MTKRTGSWFRSDDPPYIIAMRGKFSSPRARRPFIPGRWHDEVESEYVSYSMRVLVVNVDTGDVD